MDKETEIRRRSVSRVCVVWQCPSPQSGVTAAGVHRDDAIRNPCAKNLKVKI